MNQKKTFWEHFTQGYLFIIRDEINLENLRTIRFSLAMIVVFLAMLFVLFFIPTYFLADYIVNRQMEFSDSPQAQVFRLMEKSDSLEQMIVQQNAYHENLRQIMTGNPPIEEVEDSITGTIQTEDIDLTEIDSIDLAFRKQFEAEGSKKKSLKASGDGELQQILFFSPVSGIVVNPYKPTQSHFGVDVVAPKNEVIKAAADGTVILSSWTQDSGHTLAVQHKHQLVSFYKHNSVLLKKVGEIVKAGDPVAIIGNSGELTDGPHLHFELWYEGNTVNPEDFISF